MKLAWLTDIHLNFIDTATREQFYQELVERTCDDILISGDITEDTCIKDLFQELASFNTMMIGDPIVP